MAADNRYPRPYADQRKNHILDRLLSNGRVDAIEVAESPRRHRRDDPQGSHRTGTPRATAPGARRCGAGPIAGIRTGGGDSNRSSRRRRPASPRRRWRICLAQGSVLIDAGSTTAKLVEMFPGDRELTVYTNTMPLAISLLTRPRLTVFTLGGRLRNKTFAEVGDWAVRALAEINVDVAFLGTNGISMARGLTTPDPAEAAVKRLMLGCAAKRVLLADHSKFGVVKGTKHGDLDDIDVLISDTGLTDDQYTQLRTAGIEVERT